MVEGTRVHAPRRFRPYLFSVTARYTLVLLGDVRIEAEYRRAVQPSREHHHGRFFALE